MGRADRMSTRLLAASLLLFGAHSFTLTPMMMSIGAVDLSERWNELVKGGHIVATTSLKDGDSSELQVEYGVKFLEDKLIEFVSIVKEIGASPHRERIQGINETLTALLDGTNRNPVNN